MDLGLKDKTAIVTGSGRGLGRQMALMLAEEGADLVVTDIDGSAAQKTVSMIEAKGGKAVALTADVTVAADVEEVAKAAIDTFGRIDVPVSYTHLTLPTIYSV